jgi:hypothetical protein
MGAHTGTHIGAPLHTRRGGSAVDEIGLDVLVGPARAVLLPAGTAGREPSDISVPVHEGMLHWGRRPASMSWSACR